MTSALADIEARLHRLEDLEAIRLLVSRYAWFAALSDAEEMANLFTPDGVLDQPTSVKTGRTAIAAYFRSCRRYIVPVVSNFIIEVTGNESARATCKMITNHTGSKPGTTGWYDDLYERVNVEWLFASRRWTTQHPLPA